METLANKITKAAQIAKSLTFGQKLSEESRIEILKTELVKFGLTCEFIGNAPNKGASFSVVEMKTAYRVNVRCGYGKHNYAPCVEIKKA
jgi:hypothetical protein